MSLISRRSTAHAHICLWPFVVAAAFRFTDWLGWPTLFIGTLMWIGSVMILAEGNDTAAGAGKQPEDAQSE